MSCDSSDKLEASTPFSRDSKPELLRRGLGLGRGWLAGVMGDRIWFVFVENRGEWVPIEREMGKEREKVRGERKFEKIK